MLRPVILLIIAAFIAGPATAQDRVPRLDHPNVRLSARRELRLSYAGPLEAQRMLINNAAQPASLASADFDEDGVPDLASGYRTPRGGLVTMHRGNVDAIYPNAPEAQRRK